MDGCVTGGYTVQIADCTLPVCDPPGQLVNPSRKDVFKLQHELEKRLESGELKEAECPLLHVFSKGSYARSIFIPAGSLLVGKTHRHRHLLIMAFGDVEMTTDEGIERLVGFNVRDSKAGIKRCVYAHADTVITTIHLTDETDLEKIEDDVIIRDPVPSIEQEKAA